MGQREALDIVAVYEPTEVSKTETKQGFCDSESQRKECAYVLMDAKARTGRKIAGDRSLEGVLGAYGRDELSSLLLGFVETNKLALTNTLIVGTRNGRVSHTYVGVRGSNTSNLKRINYTHTRYAHRGRVRNVVLYPQSTCPAKANSDHNIAVPTVDLRGGLPIPALNRPPRNRSNSADTV